MMTILWDVRETLHEFSTVCFVVAVSKRDGEEQVVCEGTSVYDQQRCAHNRLQSGSLTVKPSMYHVQLLGFTEGI